MSKATGVRTEAPGNPVPPPSPVAAEESFLQMLKSNPKPDLSKKMKAVELLRKAAKELHSKALERLGMEVSNHLTGPFDQVNNMIEKMIFRLMDEQTKEDEHKAWCDKELEKTQTMEDNKNEKIDDLKAELEVENAAVQKLTEEIKEADDMIASIVKFQKEATEVRETGKSENKLAIKDSKAAQEAIANAVAVLEAFYKESGEIPKEPWEFIQKGKKAPVELGESPSTWDSSYTGVADPKKQPGGIITVLEEISSDFSRMESETRAQEEVDQQEYEETMKANDIEKARRTKEAEMKAAEKGRRVDKIASLQSSKKDVSAELEKTVQYMKDLQPACVDGDSTYEDRKTARSSEIKALQDAQGILADAFKEKADPEGFLQSRKVKRHS
jgi:methyl-accepting chemotaxis protein